MMPVIPSCVNNIVLIPGTPFTTRTNECLRRCTLSKNSTKQKLSSREYVVTLSSVRFVPHFRSGFALHHKSRIHVISGNGTQLAVDESDPSVEDKVTGGASSDAIGTSKESSVKPDANVSPAQSKYSRSARRSEMPMVKPEELIPGAVFTGKVRSIQQFGAFVDFGAFTDGLVHVSKLSDTFVKNVGDIVSVGQEVKVRVVEADLKTRRISLTMRDRADVSNLQQRKDDSPRSDKRRPPGKSTSRSTAVKKTNFLVGQDLVGTVMNSSRSGALISLPEGEEGFLPRSEEQDGGVRNIMGNTSLQVGQEISVRVLRIRRGQLTLTMKTEAGQELDSKLIQGAIHTATSPFLLAFHKNKDVAAYLNEREKVAEPAERTGISKMSDEMDGKVNQTETKLDEMQDQQPSNSERLVSALSAVKLVEDDETSSKEVSLEATKVHDASNEEEAVVRSEILAPEERGSASNRITEEASAVDMAETDGEVDLIGQTVDRISSGNLVSKEVLGSPENIGSESLQSLNSIGGSIEEKVEISTEILSSEDGVSDAEEVNTADGLQNERKTTLSAQIAGPTLSGNAISKETTDNQADSDTTAKDLLQIPTPGNEVFSSKIVEDKEVGIQPDKNGSITSSIGQIDVPTLQQSTTEENVTVADSNTQSEAPSPVESTIKAAISPALVKQLREETGAGMMDCKKALSETGGDLVQAQEFLRKKGLASADKKASRATAEGRIGSYIHDSRIGVLIEVNCETDFVSRGEIFKELVDDLAMQVAACPQVQYLMTEDVPQEIVEKERVIEMQKEDLLSKPEQIRAKIVEGRIRKRLEELALLEQPYIKNDKLVVKDWVKQTIATIGENMKVKRFVRYNLGEGLEKKSQDFAAEVAAQTAAKSAPSLGKDQPAVIEIKETVDEPLKATVSAALVKQLREETGAGMMDCKKALSETEGDLEKAQEYLRKKGLSTADKKSSRLAAEGRIGSYIHDTRIGVLIEVNCETDFVGRSARFKELADDLAMQVVACPQVQYVSIQDIPESIISKEKALEMQREDLLSKPENIRERIVEGRIAKRLGELALIEQPFIKDDSILVKDLVKQTVATLGENIKVRRFVRFTLGETNKSEKTE